MKLLIDAREAFRPKKAGKGQWTVGFLRELRTRELDLTILADEDCDDPQAICFPRGPLWHLNAARFARKSDADVYISPTSFIVPLLLGSTVAYVPIIHDLIAFQSEPHDTKAKLIERMLLKRVLLKAHHICTVSVATRNDLLHRFPRISPSYVSPVYAGPMADSVPCSSSTGKHILCVGTLCPRKNQERLLKAYGLLPVHLRSQYPLILVGSRGWHDAEILRLVRSTEGAEWRGYLSDLEYADLLSHAAVFAFPSLYEGFGMAVLDAMQRGIPVLTSDRGSLKEIAGEAALVVNPESERSIATGLEHLLTHPDFADSLRIAGPAQAERFSWKRTVDLLLSAVSGALY